MRPFKVLGLVVFLVVGGGVGPTPALPAEEPPKKVSCENWLGWSESERIIYTLGLVDGSAGYVALKARDAQTPREQTEWMLAGGTVVPLRVYARLLERCMRNPGELLFLHALVAYEKVLEENRASLFPKK